MSVEKIKLSFRDQWRPIDNIRTRLFFIVKSVLDEDLLIRSMHTLIREHLPILACHIAKDEVTGDLEYRPTPVDGHGRGDRPFAWSSQIAVGTLDGALVPPSATEPKSIISWLPAMPALELLWTPEDWARERNDEKIDTPLLLIHMVKYDDATVLATSLPHAVADQMGQGAFMRAWLEVAAGKQPADFLTLAADELQGSQNESNASLSQGKGTFRLTTEEERAQVLQGLMSELLPDNTAEERRIMFLLSEIVEARRNQLMRELQQDGNNTVLSAGDVVAAILLKLTHLDRELPKMVTLSTLVNLRGRHSSLPKGRPYLHNAAISGTSRFSMDKSTPLREIAVQHRQSVSNALIPENIEHSLAVMKAMHHKRIMRNVCEPMELSYVVSNWCRAWDCLDFSSVAIDSNLQPMEDDSPSLFRPVILGQSLERSQRILRFNSAIMCEAAGGYWCDWACSAKNFTLLEAMLETDPMLEKI